MIQDNPEIDAELDKLGAELLSQSDAEPSLSAVEPEAATPATVDSEPTGELEQPDHSESAPEEELSKAERKRDAQGRFIKADGSIDENQEEAAPTSEYEAKKAERKAKEQVRLDKTWQNVEARKEELSQYEQQIQQYEAQVRAAAQQQQQRQGQPRADGQYSAREVWDAGNEFNQRAIQAFKDGDYEEGEKNNSLAQEAWKHSQELGQKETQTVQQTRQSQFLGAQHQLMQQMIEKDEELGNAESPISKAVQGVMGDEKLWTKLRMFPDAFPMAVEIAKLRMDAGIGSEWKEKYNKAEAELTRLRKATTPLGSSATSVPRGDKSVDNMSPAEIDRELEKLERQAWREESSYA